MLFFSLQLLQHSVLHTVCYIAIAYVLDLLVATAIAIADQLDVFNPALSTLVLHNSTVQLHALAILDKAESG